MSGSRSRYSLDRRQFIGGAGAVIGATALGMPAASDGQSSLTGKDEKVWLGMTQAELDAAYSQGAYAPNRDLVLRRWQQLNVAARRRMPDPEVHSYGESPIERLQVFHSDKRNAPIHVFVHGGAWQVGSADGYGFVAEPIVTAGGTCVLLDFASMDDEGIRLSDICRQVRDGVAWVYRNAERFGGDRDRLFVSGHSSGGHLASVVLTTDWQARYDLPADAVKGGIFVSGIFDLAPVRLSHRNSYLDLSDDEVALLSAERQIAKLVAPVVVVYGTEETPEFQRQSRDFAKAVEAAGKPVRLVVAEAHNHFEIAETYANPYGIIGREVLKQMELVPGL